jgi:hypothetical protein
MTLALLSEAYGDARLARAAATMPDAAARARNLVRLRRASRLLERELPRRCGGAALGQGDHRRLAGTHWVGAIGAARFVGEPLATEIWFSDDDDVFTESPAEGSGVTYTSVTDRGYWEVVGDCVVLWSSYMSHRIGLLEHDEHGAHLSGLAAQFSGDDGHWAWEDVWDYRQQRDAGKGMPVQ